jgi:hypothetical protein
MIHVPVPFTDAVLQLTPPWQGVRGLVVLLLVGPLLLFLIVRLYAYELKLVRPAAARRLLALRLLVVVLLLCFVALQPVVVRSVTRELPSRVLVAVDRSDSMNVADPHRPADAGARLARTLQLPVSAGARVEDLTRSQIAHKLFAADGGGLLAALADKHEVELLGFARDAWDVKKEQFDTLFTKPGASGVPRDTAFTDLNQPLERALRPNPAKLAGVVLLTDGQHSRKPSDRQHNLGPFLKATELGERGVPIYPVMLGQRQAPPDVAVVAVQAPATVSKDVEVPVTARVRVTGLAKQDLLVTLQHAGQPPLRQEVLKHLGPDREYTVRFVVRLDQSGKHLQTLVVKAQPVPKETRTDNNSLPVVIKVDDARPKVLLVDGEARWEYHYLASALQRDPTVQVQRVLFQPPLLNAKLTDDQLERLGHPRRSLPPAPGALADYQCIILGDVSPDQLVLPDRNDCDRLEKYVKDHGGTLVIVAGQRFMPLAFAGLREPGADLDPLFKLLPIEEPRVVRPPAGFPVTLTREGKRTTFLQMEETPAESEQRWAQLPRHFWGVVGRAKPGAAVLAYFADPAAAKPQPEDSAARDSGLIVRQHYGHGQVLFVGLASTWRWRYQVGDLYHHRFWGQVIRWAAAEHVRFGAERPVYQEGEEVKVVLSLEEGQARELAPGADVRARVIRLAEGGRKEETVAQAALVRKTGQAEVLEGRVPGPLPAGPYAVELVVPDAGLAAKLVGPDGLKDRLRTPFFVTPAANEETTRLEANEALLRELARRSGGKVLAPEEAPQLVELLRQRVAQHTERSERKLWQEWGALVLLLALLTAEWVGRKLAGLP